MTDAIDIEAAIARLNPDCPFWIIRGNGPWADIRALLAHINALRAERDVLGNSVDALAAQAEKAEARAEKFKDQVIDTCKRVEKAEAALTEARARSASPV